LSIVFGEQFKLETQYALTGKVSYSYCDLPKGLACIGDAYVDFAKMEVTLGDREVRLTATEFKLLAFFFQNPERVIYRTELLARVWGHSGAASTRTVDVHVSNLRRKLEKDPSNPAHLCTVHCVGYKFIP
jgi:two-component system response regulator RegX3